MDLTPKEFEILLREFCKQDLPKNFSVTHNTYIIGNESENKRQIDVEIKGKLGISDILICGEARNWNDKLGNESIDGLVGKYLTDEIKANKVIAFSNYGFTEPAISRAKKKGIELLMPEEPGHSIKVLPHLVCIGYLGRIELKLVGTGPQYQEFSLDPDEYVIIKGEKRLSFKKNLCALIADKLWEDGNKTILSDLSTIDIEEHNVLYELKSKSGYKYVAKLIQTKTNIEWDYFIENLPTGILHHINSGKSIIVDLQGEETEKFIKVLASPTKLNYESREECIKYLMDKPYHHINFVMMNPDKTDINNEAIFFSA